MSAATHIFGIGLIGLATYAGSMAFFDSDECKLDYQKHVAPVESDFSDEAQTIIREQLEPMDGHTCKEVGKAMVNETAAIISFSRKGGAMPSSSDF